LYPRWDIADDDWSNTMTDVISADRRADSSADEDLAKLPRHDADAFGNKPSCGSTDSWPSSCGCA
jgi:hypothetical protein